MPAGFALAAIVVAALGGQTPQTPPPTSPAQQTPPAPEERSQTGLRGRIVPMPQQKQSLDYFAGTWTFKRLGAEYPVSPGASSGTVTFARTPDGKLQGITEGQIDGGGSYKERSILSFDPSALTLAWTDERSGGVTLTGVGDWKSPIAVRFTLDPVKTKDATYQIRRNIAILSATSFSVTEEIAIDGGRFVRLGSAVYTKK